MIPLHADPWFTLRFADDRAVPEFRLEGVPQGVAVRVFSMDAATGGRLGLIATAATAEGGWVALPVPLVVRAGGAIAAVPGAPVAGRASGTGPIRSVLFDLDGTLVDSRPGIVAGLRHAMAEMGHRLADDEPLDWAIGPPLAGVMARLLSRRGDTRVEEAVVRYRGWYGANGIYDAQVYPGVGELLGRLAGSGLALFVATAKRVDFARTVLSHFGLAAYFRSVHGPGLDGRHARKADLVAHLLGAEGLGPAETVMVGDRAGDVEAARASGLRAVGVTWGYGGRDELRAADLLCDRPGDLLGLAARRDGASGSPPGPAGATGGA